MIASGILGDKQKYLSLVLIDRGGVSVLTTLEATSPSECVASVPCNMLSSEKS